MTEVMTEVTTEVAQLLFSASRYSLDPATADFILQRTVSVTIYVDGDSEDLSNVADDLKREAAQIMEESGYPQVGEFGPLYGSFFVTLFGRGNEPELGPSFHSHLSKLGDRLHALKEKIPRNGIRVVMVVGTTVLHVVGVFIAPPVTVPIIVIECIVIGSSIVEAAHTVAEFREAMKLGEYEPPGPKPGRYTV